MENDIIRVGVVADWPRAARSDSWSELLAEIDEAGWIGRTILTYYRVADLIINPSPDGQRALADICNEDVLIINWDAANGDPEFGADLVLRWLQHRRPELEIWVETGRVLIIEGQAVLGIPCQSAYDAAVGPGELPTSGLEDATHPLGFRERDGKLCFKTKRFPKKGHFKNVDDVVRIDSRRLVPDRMFPIGTTKLLAQQLKDLDWGEILYRGWFRRTLPWSREFPWVSLLEAGDQPLLKRHSTLQVARVGEGAVFATTMMLATTRQMRLVAAMLSCAKGNTDILPNPRSLLESLKNSWRLLITAVAGAIAGVVVGYTTPVVSTVSSVIPSELKIFENLIGVALVFGGMAAFEGVRYFFKVSWKAISDFIGC